MKNTHWIYRHKRQPGTQGRSGKQTNQRQAGIEKACPVRCASHCIPGQKEPRKTRNFDYNLVTLGEEEVRDRLGALKWRTCPPLSLSSRNSIRINLEVGKISVGSLFTQLEDHSMGIQPRARPTIDGGCVRHVVLHTEF
jgi:hypothetical protein